jgi:hypothetical protein
LDESVFQTKKNKQEEGVGHKEGNRKQIKRQEMVQDQTR